MQLPDPAIPDTPPHTTPRGRALVRLDEGRVVVALHLEGHRETVADVDDPRVLPRSLQDARSLRREFLQVDPRALVGAVFAPHDGEDPELGERRGASEDLADLPVLPGGEAVLPRQLGGDRFLSHPDLPPGPAAIASNRRRPSALPRTSSAHRSGGGIIPGPVPFSLQ